MAIILFWKILALHWMSLQEGHPWHHAIPTVLKFFGEILALHQMSLQEGHLQHCTLNNGNYIILGNAHTALDVPPGGTSVASRINKWLSNSLVKNSHCTRCPSWRDICSIAC